MATDAPIRKAVPAVSRRDAVIHELTQSIVLGDLKPGDNLTEVGLATSLNVSRPTIREALSQLAHEGLLTQEPFRGFRVSNLGAAEILDIANTRVALDEVAIDAILSDETGSRFAHVLQAWETYRVLEFDKDPVVQHDAHITFHEAIWAASENSMLMALAPVMRAHMTIALAVDQIERSNAERTHSIHEDLIATLKTKKRDKIIAAFETHTLGSAEELVGLLDESNK
jgi:DNA-binding GntR family transcriptional regulator